MAPRRFWSFECWRKSFQFETALGENGGPNEKFEKIRAKNTQKLWIVGERRGIVYSKEFPDKSPVSIKLVFKVTSS